MEHSMTFQSSKHLFIFGWLCSLSVREIGNSKWVQMYDVMLAVINYNSSELDSAQMGFKSKFLRA